MSLHPHSSLAGDAAEQAAHQQSISIKQVVDVHETSIDADVYISICIDKFSIRYQYDCSPESIQEYDQLFQFRQSVLDGSFGKQGKVWQLKKSPFTRIKLLLGEASTVFVQYGFAQKRHWTWVEFNPAKLGEDVSAMLNGILATLFTHGMWTLVDKGRLARIDIALDIRPAKFNDYLFVDRRLRTSSQSYQQDGTTYLGVKNGRRVIAAYDKGKEQLEKAGIVYAMPWLRLEARIRDPSKKPLSKIQQLANPFLTLRVVDRLALEATDCIAVKPIQAALAEGIPMDQAFHHLPGAAKPEAWKALAQLQPSWWKPVDAWQGYQHAFDWLEPLCDLTPGQLN